MKEDRAFVLLKDPLGHLRITSRPLVEKSDDVMRRYTVDNFRSSSDES